MHSLEMIKYMNSPKGLAERKRKLEEKERLKAARTIEDYIELGVVEHVGTDDGMPVFALKKSN